MAWFIFLLTIFLNGIIIQDVFFRFTPLVRLGAGFIVGSLLSIQLIYSLVSFTPLGLESVLWIYLGISVLFYLLFVGRLKKSLSFILRLRTAEILLIFSLLVFSFYLFAKTFNYDDKKGQFLIASNVYQDFAVHIAFIRSFSLGENFPAEIPFFAGEKAQYHFMFDFYAGILEFLGLRIDIAFNLISALAFSFLLIFIFFVAFAIFSDKRVGILSVALFLCNSSLSFINFVKETPRDVGFFSFFWHNVFYRGDGPLGENTIAVYWNLNTYVNQRHFIFGLLFALFVILALLEKKNTKPKAWMLLAILVGLFPLWHASIFLSVFILFLGFFLFNVTPRKKTLLIAAGALFIALPQMLLVQTSSSSIAFRPGFLLSDNFTAARFFIFWFWNLGLTVILSLIGFLRGNSSQKKFFFATAGLFIIPNLFQLSGDIASNHKFINLWIIFMSMFSAWVVVGVFSKKKITDWIISIALVFFFTFSGILDFLVIKNDVRTRIDDYPQNTFMRWVMQNVDNNKIILTSGEIYDPVSLLGKRVFLGRTYYVQSYGGNPYERLKRVESFFSQQDVKQAELFLEEQKIEYVILYKGDFAKNNRKFEEKFFKNNFQVVYEDAYGIVLKV